MLNIQKTKKVFINHIQKRNNLNILINFNLKKNIKYFYYYNYY